MSPYPTPYQIEEMFCNRNEEEIFHTYLADRIDVSVSGTDFHVSGTYKTVDAFHDNIKVRIEAAIKLETRRCEVRKVIGGGESAWAAVESYYEFESKEGREYKLEMVDLVRFDSNGKIAQMKEFMDSVAIHNLVDEHEKKMKEDKTGEPQDREPPVVAEKVVES
ncbi:uncharacterized protein KY384_004774 [Bacidia gigantensis]|uniref:uncharacterized protein n=1 Tax=Bacidia gigantensis TaxID=2732470 RepID=UPI001D056702|nr:uncharacterized protein KY384_004774 [Bacidia gigantensis]KAG8530273.1 hypothetical protein KY384_004774 [Bacidia gigantensis]